jgi:cytochrome d ubiquinol oxidase subunit I
MEGLYLWTKRPHFKVMTQFWIKIFALTFALGVATGLVQTFAFGTNWSRYSRFVGDVFGSALAAEGMFAFFLEAGFLGVLLFGWDRISPGLHYLSTICVMLGAHFSAVWIVVANSWMQTPAGFRLESGVMGTRAVITDFWAMVWNPSSFDRLFHVLLGCWLTGAFLIVSVSSYYLIKKRHIDMAFSSLKIGIGCSCMVLCLQLFSGDRSARLVAHYQPAKFAAFEGIYKTQPSTPLTVVGRVHPETQSVSGLKIPKALSFLVYRDGTTPVVGLDQIPKEEWPNVPWVFQFYHLMIGLWGVMILITGLGLWQLTRGVLKMQKSILWLLVISVALPHIAQQAGWAAAEVGRQPWIVWHLLRTQDGVSTTISPNQVNGSIWMFSFIYLLLFILFVFLLDRKIKEGPDENLSPLYRDPY